MATRRVEWPRAWRIIASRHPPIDLFERLTPDPAVWGALIALEELTNPRVRDEVGDIALVAPEDRVSGPGASYVMASFTHRNPKGSRFSDGSYGVYYAAARLATAIVETVYHFEAFARDGNDPPRMEDMRVLVGSVAAVLEDVGAVAEPQRSQVLELLLVRRVAAVWTPPAGSRRTGRSVSQRPASPRRVPGRLQTAGCWPSASGAAPQVPLERQQGRSLLRLPAGSLDHPGPVGMRDI